MHGAGEMGEGSMSIIKSIADAHTHVVRAGGATPNRLRLAPGMIGILRNELGMEDGEPLREFLGMRIEVLPAIQVDHYAYLDHAPVP